MLELYQMKIILTPGSYIVAVSGGVDSVVLLHNLQQIPGLRLIVAHFDHGIRAESDTDQLFVRDLAKLYKLPYVFKRAELGAGASEATARAARYGFLRQAQQAAGFDAIITAHHKDDVLETAIINIIRGSGRRGLSSLQSTAATRRPLLGESKATITAYAVFHNLQWKEDSTNADDKYLRNYIRHYVLPKFTESDQKSLYNIIVNMRVTNSEIDQITEALLAEITDDGCVQRDAYSCLPHPVAKELMVCWLRRNNITVINTAMIERLVLAAKTAAAGKRFNVKGGLWLWVMTRNLALAPSER